MKQCPRCGEAKATDQFGRNRAKSDGLNVWCRPCVNEVAAARYREIGHTRVDWQRERREETRRLVILKYGGCCACCGESELVFLCIDHVNGGGTQDRGRSPHSVYRRLRRESISPDYQVLCFNCNAAKERGQCPHQLKKMGLA